jgi:hypothetical protein
MPWVADPDGLTSHYERPKGQKAKPRAGSLADLASQFNVEQAARNEADTPPVEIESFGARMARLKREKADKENDPL